MSVNVLHRVPFHTYPDVVCDGGTKGVDLAGGVLGVVIPRVSKTPPLWLIPLVPTDQTGVHTIRPVHMSLHHYPHILDTLCVIGIVQGYDLETEKWIKRFIWNIGNRQIS